MMNNVDKMTVAVIGANGKSGRVFVSEALRAGYKVRAGVRGLGNLPKHSNLRVIKCDATNLEDVRNLLRGSNTVVSLIGHGKKSPKRLQTDSIKNVCSVMQDLGIHRIVSLTGTGVRNIGDRPSIMDKIANYIIATIDPHRVQDGIEHAKVLRSSGLKYTIVRVLKLSSREYSGEVNFSLHGPAELITPRKKVALGVLQILQNDSYIEKEPIIVR